MKVDDSCEEIFECKEENEPVCPEHSNCKDVFASFECTCGGGFLGDMCQGHQNCAFFKCIDDDECALDPCAENMFCNNTIGSFDCHCVHGMEKINEICVDIDECTAYTDPCPDDSSCKNTHKSFECHCNTGFSDSMCAGEADCLDLRCDDIDECSTGDHLCEEFCTNTFGNYSCSCDVTKRQIGLYSCEVLTFDGSDLLNMDDDELKRLIEKELFVIQEKASLIAKKVL